MKTLNKSLDTLLGSWFLHCFITEVPKQMKPAGCSIPLKFKPCRFCSPASSAVGFERFSFIDTSMAGQGIAKARRSSCLLEQWFDVQSMLHLSSSILTPRSQLSDLASQQELPVNLSFALASSTWLTPIRLEHRLPHMLERQLFQPSSLKTLVKAKLNTKQMLIITSFPQTTLSQLTASSFYFLGMLRPSSLFLHFPCRSIIMSCPSFLLDGSQLPDFRSKMYFHPHLSPFLLLICSDPQAVWLLCILLSMRQQWHSLTQLPYKMDNILKGRSAEI